MNAIITEANFAFRLNMYMFEEIQGNAATPLINILMSYFKDFVDEMTYSKRFRK
jgi:heme oxygenase